MNIFDDLFNGKKSKFEETMDNLLDQTVDKVKELAKEPFTDKLTKTFNEADALMTESLEAIRDGREVPEEVQIPEGREMPDFEASEKKWDGLFDEIIDNELGKYKLCPKCGEMVPAEGNYCRNCGSKLPDLSAAFTICPKCGTRNRSLALNCEKCGAELPFIPEEMLKQTKENDD